MGISMRVFFIAEMSYFGFFDFLDFSTFALKIRKLQQYINCLFFPKVGHLGHVCPFF